MTNYVSLDILETAMENIRQSPAIKGTIDMIVCRPDVGQRKLLDRAEICVEQGLVGDNWQSRWNKDKRSKQRHLDMQIVLMNTRTIDVIANGDRKLWPLAGDQFFVDFDLSEGNVPVGSRLKIGTAVIEVTAEPHLACMKFKERFGKGAVNFVNSDEGKSMKLRGINAKVISPGVVTNGGVISKLAPF